MKQNTTIAEIKKVIFQKERFAIFSGEVDGISCTIKGNVHILFPDDFVGHQVSLRGKMVENEKYSGLQFEFNYIAIKEGVDYFWNCYVTNLPETAKRNIVSKFGYNPEWLSHDNAQNVLNNIAGISEHDALKIMKKWEEYTTVKKLEEILAPYGLSQAVIAKIYEEFKSHSIVVVEENPYALTSIPELGFKKVDELALSMGFEEDDPKRIVAAMSYCLKQNEKDGSTVMTVREFVKSFNTILVSKEKDLKIKDWDDLNKLIEIAPSIVKNHPVILDDKFIALKRNVMMDGFIISHLLSSNDSKELTIEKEKAVELLESHYKGKHLVEMQREAVIKALTSGGSCIISGFAGTGKTTTSKVTIDIISDYHDLEHEQIVCCALSGVAANRIKTQTGYDGKTIHSLLGYDEFSGKWVHNAENPIDKNLVILDESGMVDTYLMYSLLSAIDFSKTKLIMLGDTEQLLPVGSGQPFLDIINAKIVPHQELTKIYRTDNSKAIALIASEIRDGNRPSILPTYSDVKSYRSSGASKEEVNDNTLKTIKNLTQEYAKELPKQFKEGKDFIDYIYSYQVITPRKSGPLSTEEINPIIREIVLPACGFEIDKDFKVSLMDKVIHLKNKKMMTTDNQEVRVFNGMVGVVTKIDKIKKKFTVFYPLEMIYVAYNESDLDKDIIGFAWCLTIHKTQGSEYDNIVIPFSKNHWNMLNKKLTYTAVTRAKESCHLVGDVQAFHQACVTVDTTIRITTFNIVLPKVLT